MRGKRAKEPHMTAEERRHLAGVLNLLGVASTLEKKARSETDRLMGVAWRAGATDHTLAAAMGLTVDAARMRRRRAHLRGEDKGRGRLRAL